MSCRKLSNNNNTLKHTCIVSNAPVANWLLLPSIWNQISNKIIVPETKGRMAMNVHNWLEIKSMPTCHDSSEGHVIDLGSSYSKVPQHCSHTIYSILSYCGL